MPDESRDETRKPEPDAPLSDEQLDEVSGGQNTPTPPPPAVPQPPGGGGVG